MPTRPRRKNFFRPPCLPGELCLAASPLLYRERRDYLTALRAALSAVEGARVTLTAMRKVQPPAAMKSPGGGYQLPRT
jgi:hypothetical protein